MKFLTRLVLVILSFGVLTLTGCRTNQIAQSSQSSQTPTGKPIGSSGSDLKQSQNNTSMPGSMNLNMAAFKNMGDLAFVWQDLLYVLNGKTGEVKQHTESGKALHPVWSFDGQWVAFLQAIDPEAETGRLWRLVRRDGQQLHQVQGMPELANGQRFSWAPTDNVLAVSGKDGLWLVPVEGEPQLKVRGSLSYASWSPDGKSIAYSVTLPFSDPENRDDALYTVIVNSGQAVKQITAPKSGIQVAAWWPNGKGLLYWVDPQHSASLAADGMALWSLRFGDTEPKLLSTGLAHPGWQSLSSQGQLLMVAGGGREVWTGKDLIITDPRAGSTKELPNPDGCVALDPSFSPDGNRIAFVAAKDLGKNVGGFSTPQELANWVATRTLWIENTDGSGAHPLKSAGTGVYQPAWSKDGTQILYVQDNYLWMIGSNGENPEKILGPFPDWKDQFGYYGYLRHDDFSWFQPE